jgi:hypothetical protein
MPKQVMDVGTLQTGYSTYTLQPKIKGKTCAHVLPHVTAAPEPASLLREGSGVVTCPGASDPAPLYGRAPALPRVSRHRTPPRHLGGLQR